MPVTICPARSADAGAIAAIYDHHARHGSASFDSEGPTAADWALKIDAIAAPAWPLLIARIDGDVVGYAYATQFRDRPAYVHACENSIYVAPGRTGQGIGRMLLEALIAASGVAGSEQMIAVVGAPEPASIALHRRCGFV